MTDHSKLGTSALDTFAKIFANVMLTGRWVVIPLAVAAVLYVGQFAATLEFSNNYRVFFSKENPDLTAFEDFQDTYTKNDNFFFVIEADQGDVFTPEILSAIEDMTADLWQTPYALRVDSITNFQHTYAIDDDLIVEDLFKDVEDMPAAELANRKSVALGEPLLAGQLITPSGDATAINVTLQYPEASLTEVPEAVAVARDIQAKYQAALPETEIYLTGVSMLNNAFVEAPNADFARLIPAMFVIIIVLSAVALRSVSATIAMLVIIILSIIGAMGFAGFIGMKLTPPSASAPIIILTLAVADTIHVLMAMRKNMKAGAAKRDALVDAIRVNFLAITITSVTTMVGFMALNFADSPPLRDLGNVAAVGIFFAWALTLTILPGLIAILPFNPKPDETVAAREPFMRRLANVVIAHANKFAVVSLVAALALVAMIPTIQFDDNFREYFDDRIEFRSQTDQMIDYFGFYPVEYSIQATEPGGISDPAFLRKLEAFTLWAREQPNVMHVYSLSDIMKRLNRNLNGDDPAFYRLPDNRELAAQYLLLYELSLPFGLDLNDRVNIDKSATRVTVNLSGETSSAETKQFLRDADAWFLANAPEMRARGTSANVMFSFIAERNVNSMILGTILAIVAISLIMILALRSLPLGLMSLIPNGLPILTAFGAWAVLNGFVGFSVSIIASISLGIVVDDTVHFMTKYRRARLINGLSPENAIRYAFENVGIALVVNTIVLTAGFMILTLSAFKINAELGLLTSLSIVFALILDFFLLPALLLGASGGREKASAASGSSPTVQPAE